MYSFLITRFLPLNEQRMDFATGDAAAIFASEVETSHCVVSVSQLVGGIDYGNFYIWCNEHSAHVRLDEHREHYASHLHPSSCTEVT